MTKPKSTPQDTPPEASTSPSSAQPSTRALVVLTVLGLASALWALFLWSELLLIRSGGAAFCDLGAGSNCAAVWDSGFASTVHDLTGMPVAGWGLIWSLVAALVPLWTLKQRADGADTDTWVGSVKLTAAAGVAAVVVFLLVSASMGEFCIGCIVTYIVTLAYAGIALWGWRTIAAANWPTAALRAGAVALVAYVGLLYPGLATPKSAESETASALAAIEATSDGTSDGTSANANANGQSGAATTPAAQATAGHAHTGHTHAGTGNAGHTHAGTGNAGHTHTGTDNAGHTHAGPGHAGHTHSQAPTSSAGTSAEAMPPADPGDLDQRLAMLMHQMKPQFQSLMAEGLRDYKAAQTIEREPRAVYGNPDAPVRITDFTDILCGHCANLYMAFDEIKNQVPAGSYSIEARQFPLDGNCNPNMQRKNPQPSVNCLAARAQICLEQDPRGHEFSGKLFANQRGLNVDKVYELAKPYIDRAQLDACMADPATEQKLQSDIAYAMEHGIRGTPLVLINGRKASGFPLFMFAMILTGGNPDHPAFASLPPPPPPGQDSHQGHGH